ncbi:palmitoyltransferase ZDHHC20-B-like isoform X2 [Gigantopelta aegis]|uniref:palmitoyltransferase ZDHHC20-B-like isoform X2 n=1 Tax=Gigantopelta aegis TaxID=1735272 RepID=UPI001B88C63D|nr:palmitoyltransferase ZDHHC20-B-like isoform X2 [Gigantopelta aegis]
MAPLPIRLCCAAVRWTPVVFITAIIIWSYYAYVVEMCIFTVDSVVEKVIYLLLYHPAAFMFAWAYWQTIFARVGSVPKEFYLSKHEVELFDRETSEDRKRELLIQYGRNLPILNRTVSGCPRYCDKCKCIKPDRCHHCSVCGMCILKMDHHCPWVNNCVGFTNYKFFVLFLGYGLLYCLYIASTSLKYFIQFWEGGIGSSGTGRFHILFLFFVSIMFGISLISLFGYHLYLSTHNRSTLEAFRAPIFQSGPDKDGFSLGSRGNFQEVFGDKRMFWFLPMFSSLGDGVSFPSRLPPATMSYQTMGNTPSLGDGVNYPTRTVDLDSDDLLGQRQRWMEEGDDDMTHSEYYLGLTLVRYAHAPGGSVGSQNQLIKN